MPVAISLRPVPSIAMRRSMSVSAVFRVTCALRTGSGIDAFICLPSVPGRTLRLMAPLGQLSSENVEQRVVLGRRADGDAQAVGEQRMRAVEVLHQYFRI